LGAGRAVVTQGYIGATAEGLTTTLGRGGSDYSAALFGAALGAAEVQIWTDVEGVLTCDPRLVPEAQPIAELSFAEAAELAAFGAKVLHPATIQPAVEADIPVTVRHTQRPEGAFTTITGRVATGRPITALATRGGLTVLTVSSTRMLHQPGFLAKLFDVFARHRVSVDLIATAEVSVRAFATVSVVRERALVAVVGERLKATPGLAGKLFGALGDLNVEMISMGANEINLSLVVAASDAPRALAQLHRVLMGESLLAGSAV
jgi:aspartate kinase